LKAECIKYWKLNVSSIES